MTLQELITENSRRHRLRAIADAATATDDAAADPLLDFSRWAEQCVTIRDKNTGRDIPFRLNRPQRRVLAILESQRRADKPLRIIMLKARQWGGSTLVQLYMAWIQIIHRRNWNSLICAHYKNTAATIRGMYSKLLASYPAEMWHEEQAPAFKPFEQSHVTRCIPARGCCITIASAENPDGVRGLDISMAHLSEVAYWPDTPTRTGSRFAQAICSGIPLMPYTLIAMESTANGVGNFFHRQWLKAETGDSAYAPVFVPWFEIDAYSLKVDDPMALWQSLTPYERQLWTDNATITLEQLNWYHTKSLEMADPVQMQVEFPSSAAEAFAATSAEVFDVKHIEALRRDCRQPRYVGEVSGARPKGRDAIKSVKFTPEASGLLKIWEKPVAPALRDTYVAVVDVGGRSAKSDFSVITVIKRHHSLKPEIVAQWRGHIDHDLLAWKAAAIARYYAGALLVVESNSLETEWDGDSTYILDELGAYYPNMYYRRSRDRYNGAVELRPGFHTNRSTKALVISSLIGFVRDGEYTERDGDALNEFAVYEATPGGGYAARQGCHDDILMTRAIGLYVVSTLPPLPSPDDADDITSLLHAPAF